MNANDSLSVNDLPISSWVKTISKGKVQFVATKRSKKKLKMDFFGKK